MEYTSALGTIIFDKSCHLRDLTEVQVGCNQFAMDVAVDWLDGEVDYASERISALEGKVSDLEARYTELLALGREQVETSTHAAHSLGQLATAVLAQQVKIRSMDERMDAMREMILVLEHTWENPIVVDEEEMVVSDGSGEELEVEENEVAIPILVPGRLVPIEDKVQVLPNKLVGTQIVFELANCHGGRPLVGFPSVLAFNPNNHRLTIQYGSCRTRTLDRASRPHWVSQGGQLEYR